MICWGGGNASGMLGPIWQKLEALEYLKDYPQVTLGTTFNLPAPITCLLTSGGGRGGRAGPEAVRARVREQQKQKQRFPAVSRRVPKRALINPPSFVCAFPIPGSCPPR